jgi:hypothetical protein
MLCQLFLINSLLFSVRVSVCVHIGPYVLCGYLSVCVHTYVNVHTCGEYVCVLICDMCVHILLAIDMYEFCV